MTPIDVLVLRAPGINCEEETAFAWTRAGARPEILHIQRLIEEPRRLARCQIVTVPGGFSYGDDIASGRILASQMSQRLGDALRAFVERGGLLLGVCNGFQVLVKAGLLPGGEFAGRVTFTHNEQARYEDRWVHLEVATDRCAFLRRGARLRMPIAHGEGKVVADSPATLTALESGGFVALRYCDAEGRRGGFPINPNGSEGDVAGLTDSTGRIFGLMPHPERAIDRTHLPDWTRVPDEQPTGLQPFENAVNYLMRG